jgi:hypothetical protein
MYSEARMPAVIFKTEIANHESYDKIKQQFEDAAILLNGQHIAKPENFDGKR